MSFTVQLNAPRCKHALTLPSTGITVIFGESGCGKTTLLRAIAGLDKRAGNISLNKNCWQDKQQFLTPAQRGIGVAFQEPRLLPHKTAQQNIQLGQTKDKAKLENITQALDLTNLLTKKANTLSGGEQHRAALARALYKTSHVLLLDEPLTGLDQQRRTAAVTLIKHAAQNKPVLLVTHQLDELLTMANHLVLMDKHESIAGTLGELINHPLLTQQRNHDFSILTGQPQPTFTQDLHGLALDDGQILRIAVNSKAELPALLSVAIDARDVSLSLSRAEDSSIVNILAAQVTQLTPMHDGTVKVSLTLGSQVLRALVSNYSAEKLALKPGLSLFVQIKSTVQVR